MILKALVVCTLLLAVAWDADGNPRTDNLPHAVRTEAVEDAEGTCEAGEGATGKGPRGGGPARLWWSPRRFRRSWRPSPETAWRTVGVSQRGP